jgi:hypothetical protein
MPADHRPADDPSIPNDELLFVRIYPDAHALQAADDGSYRPNSGCLKRGDEPLSVDLGSRCTAQQTKDRDRSVDYHVAEFSAAMVRSLGCRIVRRPEADNPAHAEIYGDRQDIFKVFTGGLTKGQSERLSRLARIRLFGTTIR